jgi:hypothetical protein
MVLVWKMIGRENLTRVSGLAYLKQLFREPAIREPGRSFFVLPADIAKAKLLAWAQGVGLPIQADDCYVAPQYGMVVEDRGLLDKIAQRRPHTSSSQSATARRKSSGVYLRDCRYRPAIHCIGVALDS